MEKIVIIGGGGHAKVIISVLKKIGEYIIAGYVDKENHGDILDAKYLGSDEILTDLYIGGNINATLGIGQVNTTRKRFEVVNKIKSIGFRFPKIISKNAIINEDVNIGDGTQILDGVVINSGSKIGSFTIINTSSTVEHDCIVGDFCHIATCATLSGGVEIGDFSMIGSNAVIVQYKRITSNCLIGSGGVVINNIDIQGTYVGNPVRKIK